jgi:hypothetical protein
MLIAGNASIAALIGDGACLKVNVVANNSGPPRRIEKLREGAFAILINAECVNEGTLVKYRYIGGTIDERFALHDDGAFLGQE